MTRQFSTIPFANPAIVPISGGTTIALDAGTDEPHISDGAAIYIAEKPIFVVIPANAESADRMVTAVVNPGETLVLIVIQCANRREVYSSEVNSRLLHKAFAAAGVPLVDRFGEIPQIVGGGDDEILAVIVRAFREVLPAEGSRIALYLVDFAYRVGIAARARHGQGIATLRRASVLRPRKGGVGVLRQRRAAVLHAGDDAGGAVRRSAKGDAERRRSDRSARPCITVADDGDGDCAVRIIGRILKRELLCQHRIRRGEIDHRSLIES